MWALRPNHWQACRRCQVGLMRKPPSPVRCSLWRESKSRVQPCPHPRPALLLHVSARLAQRPPFGGLLMEDRAEALLRHFLGPSTGTSLSRVTFLFHSQCFFPSPFKSSGSVKSPEPFVHGSSHQHTFPLSHCISPLPHWGQSVGKNATGRSVQYCVLFWKVFIESRVGWGSY